MNRFVVTALFLLVLLPGVVFGQQELPTGPRGIAHQYDIAGGFNYGRANAPPGGNERFNLYGGFVSSSIRVSDSFSFAAEGTIDRANDIGPLGQNLSLFTLATGPRYSHSYHRFVPFGQILLGISHAGDSYFPETSGSSTSSTSYAVVAGGGVDYKLSKLSRRLAIRLINAEYLKTGFPNGASNSQNHLLLGAGLTFRFGMHELEPAGLLVEVPRKNDLHFTCSTNLSSIIQGQTIDVSGNAFTLPDQLALTFSWSVLGQNIAGDGRQVTLNTSTLAPGEYHVRGRAVAIDDISLTAECETFFRVTARPK